MNFSQAISLINEVSMNYEERCGEGSTAPKENTWEDVAGFVGTLESRAQQDLVMYALTGDDAIKSQCADKLLREILGGRYGWQAFKTACTEIDAVIDGVRKTEAAFDSDLAMKIHSKVAEWEADFLFRLGQLK